MANEKISATESWIRTNAPDLLQGPFAAHVAPFIKNDDLNGLAHFLQQCVKNDGQSVPSWEKEQIAQRLITESQALKQFLDQKQQPHKDLLTQKKNDLKPEH